MYILDTNVISEVRKSRPHGGLRAWLLTIPDTQLYLSAVTLGELQKGVELTRANNVAKANEIEMWVDEVAATFRILSPDAVIFREYARLMNRKPVHLEVDALIAATAKVHRMTVVTRNTKDFAGFGVTLLNPFQQRR